ncbi:hypothetical protein AB1Y20_007022 [Prymnesium parvum]|uniref:non-specific serine/threonine protein kinase n=1 Tax=Prymnesium parvum TaxID=97485 RepID=A0AB34IZ81_PRYPA
MDNYELLRKLGQGTYGTVYLCRQISSGKQCVMKRMLLSTLNSKERKSAFQEAQLLQELSHPNIVGYMDTLASKTKLYLFMQFCDGGDLERRLAEVRKEGQPIKQTQLLDWFVQMSLALQYLHSRRILHRDLKTANVFLTRMHIVKLGDFGVSRVLSATAELAKTFVGTPYYLSPELLSNQPYGHASDVWALGCIFYEIATLEHPFEATTFPSLASKILHDPAPMISPHRPDCDVAVDELLAMMLDKDPHRRATLPELLGAQVVQRRMHDFMHESTAAPRHAAPPPSATPPPAPLATPSPAPLATPSPAPLATPPPEAAERRETPKRGVKKRPPLPPAVGAQSEEELLAQIEREKQRLARSACAGGGAEAAAGLPSAARGAGLRLGPAEMEAAAAVACAAPWGDPRPWQTPAPFPAAAKAETAEEAAALAALRRAAWEEEAAAAAAEGSGEAPPLVDATCTRNLDEWKQVFAGGEGASRQMAAKGGPPPVEEEEDDDDAQETYEEDFEEDSEEEQARARGEAWRLAATVKGPAAVAAGSAQMAELQQTLKHLQLVNAEQATAVAAMPLAHCLLAHAT